MYWDSNVENFGVVCRNNPSPSLRGRATASYLVGTCRAELNVLLARTWLSSFAGRLFVQDKGGQS